jgi:hypothetical protein
MREFPSPAPGDASRLEFERSERFLRICRRWVLAPLFGFIFLASIALVIATAIEAPSRAIAVPVPAGFFLLFWLSLRFSAAMRPMHDEFVPAPTPWRLVDPTLSHWGVWRAELRRMPVEINRFRANHRQVQEYIQKLLGDWSWKSARGGGVVHISRPVAPASSPFGDGPKGWKAYRVTLDDGLVRRTGWLRLGAGWAEFQLQRNAADWLISDALGEVAPPRGRGERLAHDMRKALEENVQIARRATAPVVRHDPLPGHQHPMWDRWIDI